MVTGASADNNTETNHLTQKQGGGGASYIYNLKTALHSDAFAVETFMQGNNWKKREWGGRCLCAPPHVVLHHAENCSKKQVFPADLGFTPLPHGELQV